MVVPNKIAHTAIWVLLLGMGTFLMYVWDYSYSHALYTNASFTATDVDPVIQSHNINLLGTGIISDGSTVSHPGNSLHLIHVEGTIKEANGTTPIVTGVMYRSDLGSSCTYDPHNCAIQSNCTETATGDATVWDYYCEFGLQYTSDNTIEEEYPGGPNYASSTWKAEITASDGSNTDVDDTSYFEYAAGIFMYNNPDDLHFGTIDVGDYTTKITDTIRSYSNVRVDPVISGGDLTCDGRGTIPITRLHYSASSGDAYGSMTAVSTSPTQVTDFNFVRGSGLTYSTKPIYWQMYVPDYVRGECKPSSDVVVTWTKG